MLRKLIKHEWKATWMLPSFLCIFIILITGISCVACAAPLLGNVKGFTVQSIILLLLFIFNIILLIFSYVAVLIYFIYRFYKNLFTKEGYLMHTLPTTAGNLILSKLFCAVTWLLITSLITYFSIFALSYTALDVIMKSAGKGSALELFTAFLHTYREISAIFIQYAGINLGTAILLLILMTIAGCISGMLLPYMCFAIGHLLKKHQVAASIGFYLLSIIIVSSFTSFMSLPAAMKPDMNPKGLALLIAPMASTFRLYGIFYIISILFSIIFFFTTKYIISKKLNLN